MTDGPKASEDEARAFARSFEKFLDWIHTVDDREDINPVTSLIREFLGDAAQEESVVTRSLPLFEHVNLQAAINAWSIADGRQVDVRGMHVPMHHGRPDLESAIAGEMSPLRVGTPSFVDLPDGPASTRACLRLALLLVTDEHGRYVVWVAGPSEHERGLRLEVAGLPVGTAQQVLGELDTLRRTLNVYRGHVITVGNGPMGGVALSFAEVPSTRREDVILPEAVLARIERHALEVARHRDALRARGQHLKRGVLLFGPPGTGKTLTTGYLVREMAGYTRFLLSGHALNSIGSLTELARDLEPAVLVLEDVDLVAEDRDFGDGSSPVLFDLLDAMDGAASDADLLFLLTTNRADMLESALAARPGRVDVAVEIGLPDAEARGRLFALYGRTVAMQVDDADTATFVERMDGVTASFVKELLRRAVLESLLDDDGGSETVTAAHVTRALDDLLDSAQEVTRTLLGVGYDPDSAPPLRPGRHHGHFHGGQGYSGELHLDFDEQ